MLIFENPPVTGMTSTIVRRPLRSTRGPLIPERGSSHQAGNSNMDSHEPERLDRSPTRSTSDNNAEDSKIIPESEGSSSLALQASTTLLPKSTKDIDDLVESDCEDSDDEGDENEAAENPSEVSRKASPAKSNTMISTLSGSSRSSMGRPDSAVLEPGNGHSTVTLTQSDDISTFRGSDQTEFLLNQVLQRNEMLEKTKQELETTTATCQSLASKVTKLQRELDDAHSFIFTLQPQSHVITPTQALEEFKTLCMKVEDWVQDNLGDGLEKSMHSEEITIEGVEQFMSLVSSQGKSAFSIPKTAEFILIEAIMRFLHRRIFQLDFWCMEENALNFLGHIERSMQHLEPRRGFATIRTWRSETLLALANRPEFNTLRQQTIRDLTVDLHLSLGIFLSSFDTDEVRTSLQNCILEPATSLAHRFHLSTSRFDVEFTGLNPISARHEDMNRYEYQSLTGKILKNPAATVNNYIMDVCPGLYFSPVKADGFGEMETLKKPKILVVATKPGEREWAPPVSRPGHPATLLAWLDETCTAKKRNKPWY